MYEAILESFSFFPTLVVTNGSTLMTAEGLNIIHFFAIALIVALLTARIASKKDRAIFKRQRIATLKKCPKMCRATAAIGTCLRCMRLQFSF
jgi:hypothetical protein